MSAFLSETVSRAWYRGALWLYLLFPLMCLFWLATRLRRLAYQTGFKSSYRASVPVVVVGNITVGGTGKSPLVALLVESFRKRGMHPGIVTRGYGANVRAPVLVSARHSAGEVGDEPLMLWARCRCPVAVCPDRAEAVRVLENAGCDIILSDDGLQHYAMARDVEICVVDGERGWGNRRLLPVGPLREPLDRLKQIDFLVVNGESFAPAMIDSSAIRMDLKGMALVSLEDGQHRNLSSCAEQTFHAVAGIGNPERFFSSVENQGLRIIRHPFPDHHQFRAQDFAFGDGLPVIMTEKDAVKCRGLALTDAWYLPVEAHLSDDLAGRVLDSWRTRKGIIAPQ